MPAAKRSDIGFSGSDLEESENTPVIREFTTDAHRIIHQDAVEALMSIETASIDLIFADPPYNIGKDFDGIHDCVDESEYFNWCWKWLNECERVLKPNGTFYLMNSTQNMPRLDLYCRERFKILSRIVWTYDSSGMQARRFYGSLYEPILHRRRIRRPTPSTLMTYLLRQKREQSGA